MASDAPGMPPSPAEASGTEPPGPKTWQTWTRGAVVASVPVAFMAGITILIVILVLGTLAAVDVISLVFIVGRWESAYLPWWTGPLWNSLFLTIFAYFVGFAVAMVLGMVRAYGWGKTRNPLALVFYGPVTGYVHMIRGTPFFVQLWLVYYVVIFAFPTLNLLGWNVYMWAGLLALTLNTIGYQAEVFRGGFQSIGQGQIEAAKATGLTGPQTFLHITLPQGLRLIILPLTNEFISLFKASTILSYISVYELFVWSENLGVRFGHPIEGFLMISMYYLLINIPLSRGVSWIERTKRIPGLGTPMREGGDAVGFAALRFGFNASRASGLAARGERGAALQRLAQVSPGARRWLVPARTKDPRDALVGRARS